ncbi:NYN domain-containing protein, partial [Tomitella biformata]
MRSTCSLYVDAGYLLASAATRVTGTSLRGGIHVEYPPLIRTLIDTAETLSGLPALRVHWYDSARNGVPDTQQERIGELSKVKLRLGRFGVNGEQKGVDLRMGLDLVAHARNGASDVFFLVSGDDDLAEAVEEAQVHGIQVVLLAVPTLAGKPHGVSRHLIRAADELDSIDGAAIDAAVLKVDRKPEPEPEHALITPQPTPRPAPHQVVAAAPRPAVRTPLDLASTISP